ncbi:hypothetical protein SAMN02745973_01402 [Garciella nitratireducens DSM 15102]|uniref:Uncharacterized protein n=1 Tax=Garciella nitratireducens DSM 15102 TaxID=1121911 RepID=A0A1T4MQJ6_9FIRM|nr:hypothetical protein SAMN02745973_01402 [Garciella nitratireducens DSM 15102]
MELSPNFYRWLVRPKMRSFFTAKNNSIKVTQTIQKIENI